MRAGGHYSSIIIHYDITIYLILQCIINIFLHRKITNTNTGNHNQLQMLQIQVIQPGAFHKD